MAKTPFSLHSKLAVSFDFHHLKPRPAKKDIAPLNSTDFLYRLSVQANKSTGILKSAAPRLQTKVIHI